MRASWTCSSSARGTRTGRNSAWKTSCPPGRWWNARWPGAHPRPARRARSQPARPHRAGRVGVGGVKTYRSYLEPGVAPLPLVPPPIARGFSDARNSRYLPRIGYAHDVLHCQVPDTSRAVPLLERRADRLAVAPARAG